MSGDVRGFGVVRANPYLLRHVAWKASEGALATTVHCRIQGEALQATTDIRLSRLQVVRAGAHDEAAGRLGLPLSLVVALLKDARGDIQLSLPVGGRLADPRFDFREAIWSAVRTVAVNAITLPVSWIGRVRLGQDSRIQEIQVDPVRFEPGTARLAPDGQAQVARLAAFLDQLPEVRMALTPVISPRDLAALRREAVGATVAQVAREGRISFEAAALRVFADRFSQQPPPDAPDAVLAALVEAEPAAGSVIRDLAGRRLETVLETLGRAGIDAARLRRLGATVTGADDPGK